MILILTVLFALLIITILLIINCIKYNNEKFINKSKYFNIKHFITKLDLYIPKNNKWNDDLISRWKNHEYKTNTEILNILNKIDDKSIIIEAGGHIGDTTFFMSTYLNYIGKKSLIYVFEPEITKCNYIKDIININKITNIKIFNFGISNKYSNGSLNKKSHAGAWKIKDGNDFKIIPLDSINYEYPISFIKLDVEGFEYNALLGAKNIINIFNPILCIEMHERENKEIKEFLTKNFKYNLYIKTDIDYFYNINTNFENFKGKKFRDSKHWIKYINNNNNNNNNNGKIKYLEIGSHSGNSLINFNNLFCKNYNCELHCIDPWEDYYNYFEYKNNIKKSYNDFLFNIKNEGIENVNIHKTFSHLQLIKFKDNYFDIIYIDGNHNPEHIMEDAVLSFRKLKLNGLLIFDDVDWTLSKNNVNYETNDGINSFKKSYKFLIKILSDNDNGQCFIKKIKDL